MGVYSTHIVIEEVDLSRRNQLVVTHFGKPHFFSYLAVFAIYIVIQHFHSNSFVDTSLVPFKKDRFESFVEFSRYAKDIDTIPFFELSKHEIIEVSKALGTFIDFGLAGVVLLDIFGAKSRQGHLKAFFFVL